MFFLIFLSFQDAIPLDLYKHTDLRSVTYEGDVLNSLPKGR